jgi:hypothetical protein
VKHALLAAAGVILGVCWAAVAAGVILLFVIT